MNENVWTPHVTVATVVENKGNYLLVREQTGETSANHPVYNQPAGHLDEGESLITAAVRETKEETAWDVDITGYLGVYRFVAKNGVTYLRHGFIGRALQHHQEQPLDSGILEAVWLDYDSIQAKKNEMRSALVIQLIDDYRSGLSYPLSALHEDS